MDDDEGQVEMYSLSLVGHGELTTVHGTVRLSVEPIPAHSLDDNLVYIVFGVVQLTVHLVAAGDADVVLTAVATHDKCYVLFH